MPPHLHPRSTATSTLFAGTLLASFIVVAIPHILPCPQRRRVGYQDSEVVLNADGKPIRRIRQTKAMEGADTQAHPPDSRTPAARKVNSLEQDAELFRQLRDEAQIVNKEARDSRECPVPKPKTLFGKLMRRDSDGE